MEFKKLIYAIHSRFGIVHSEFDTIHSFFGFLAKKDFFVKFNIHSFALSN